MPCRSQSRARPQYAAGRLGASSAAPVPGRSQPAGPWRRPPRSRGQRTTARPCAAIALQDSLRCPTRSSSSKLVGTALGFGGLRLLRELHSELIEDLVEGAFLVAGEIAFGL